jgi:ribosomal-protein-alanine N-acetyltransferase
MRVKDQFVANGFCEPAVYGLNFRPATRDDLKAIMEIELSSFPSPWPQSVYAGEIKGRSWSRIVVVERKNRLIGFMVYWILNSEIRLLKFAVGSPWRRRGFGRKLLERLIETSKAEGLREIQLEVRVSNKLAINLCRKLNFEETAVKSRYYSDNDEDALRMSLNLEE